MGRRSGLVEVEGLWKIWLGKHAFHLGRRPCSRVGARVGAIFEDLLSERCSIWLVQVDSQHKGRG